MANKFDDDATQFVDNKSGQTQGATPPVPPVTPTQAGGKKADAKAKKDNAAWKSVAASAGTGVVIGTIAGISMSAKSPDEPVEEEQQSEVTPNHSEVLSNPDVVDDQVMVATGVNDNMSFSQAFAEARAEVGPGGVFEWHGTLYGTYTADEWNSMSAADKADYNSHFAWNNIDTPTENHNDTPAEGYYAQHTTHDVPAEEIPSEEIAVVDVVDGPGSDDVQVEVLGVYHDQETGGYVGEILLDDMPAVIVDVDGDQVFDVLVADFNGNGEIENDEFVPIEDAGITVEDALNMQNQEIDYAGMDDVAGIDDPMIYDA